MQHDESVCFHPCFQRSFSPTYFKLTNKVHAWLYAGRLFYTRLFPALTSSPTANPFDRLALSNFGLFLTVFHLLKRHHPYFFLKASSKNPDNSLIPHSLYLPLSLCPFLSLFLEWGGKCTEQKAEVRIWFPWLVWLWTAAARSFLQWERRKSHLITSTSHNFFFFFLHATTQYFGFGLLYY